MEISRRDFLKWGAAGAVLLALEDRVAAFLAAEEPNSGSVSRTTGKFRQAIPSTCLQCPARCGILGFVEGGRLVKIQGNPKNPNNRGRLCAKGQAGINLLYNPDRVLQPLKRAGSRGEGRWKRVSWEEAFEEVASRLKELRRRGSPQGLVFQEGVETHQGFTRRFLHAFGAPHTFYRWRWGGANKKVALALTWGADFDISDVAHTRYILNFGANPFESQALVPFALRIVEGRVGNRAKLVTFDPRLSNTAGRSDEWFPLRPGTDGLVALAMAHTIVKEGLYDRAFMEKWTNYPLDKLAVYLAPYTPEWAEKESGVMAKDIRRIANEFATTKPATTITGKGLSMHRNGAYNERCVALLNALTGNIDVKGGSCLPRTYPLSEPEPRPPEPNPGKASGPFGFPLMSYLISPKMLSSLTRERKIGLYMTYMYNPAYSHPQSQVVSEILKDEKAIPYFVAIDSYMTESAALADLILPSATYLEGWYVDSPPSYELIPLVCLGQPIVRPQGEALPITDILIELARRVGGGMEGYFDFGTTEDYMRAAISKIEGLMRAGGLDYLKEHGVWFDPKARPQYRSYEKGGFRTPSGKFEVYSPFLERERFAPLPIYEPIGPHGRMKEEELILITFKWNVQTSKTSNSKWLSEIVHENPMWIHPQTAKARGIQSGDQVQVRSSAGQIISKAHLTEAIHPRVVAISGSVGHWGYGRIAQALRFKSEDPDTQLLWWDKHSKGINPNLVIPEDSDPICGGQAWMDTVVTVVKV